ncbi:MAG TPA: response regulator [Pyrinomonadaceae bacterium]|nr:response regulator [Pyrinomonadaceae bacterium]
MSCHAWGNRTREGAILIAGRKLLLADDSIAIQKVIDLTFTDEGMEVTTVGDGQDALDKLDQITPDVVLADIFMPGVDGYELCKFIKQSERFSGVPVMLLVGTFEPFDEAEARLAGADDVVTKPFQSIRQLVSRVGSLLGNESAEKDDMGQPQSTLGLRTQPIEAPEAADQDEQANVRVFVEAPIMSEAEPESPGADEQYAPPNVELQTADTRKLERIDAAMELATDDTLEMEAVSVKSEREVPFQQVASAPEAHMNYQSEQTEVNQGFDESVLDLGDVDSFATAQAEDDFVLDLDSEPVAGERFAVAEAAAPSAPVGSTDAPEAISAAPPKAPAEASLADTHEWAIVTPAVEPQNWEVKTDEPAADTQVSGHELSAEAIEAISRRVVEHLSDKVVREIAWEVVPELSELLIKKRLEEQK